MLRHPMTTHAPHKVRDGVGHVQGQGVDCIDTARLYQHVLRVFAAQVGPHYLVPLRVTGLCGHSPVVTIGSIAARTDSLVVDEVHYQRSKAVVAIRLSMFSYFNLQTVACLLQRMSASQGLSKRAPNTIEIGDSQYRI